MKKTIKILIIAALCSVLSCKSSSTSMIVNTLFGDWENKINSIIQSAESSGLILEVNAASQTLNVVERAKIAYESSLNKTIDAITGEEEKTFTDITILIDKLQGGVSADIDHVQNMISMVPGMNRMPQVRACTGNVIAPNEVDYTLVVNGGFWDAAKEGYHAVLKLNGKSIEAITKNDNLLEFKIPKNLFTTSTKHISYIPCSIEVDYEKSNFLVFKSKETAKFSQRIIVLPPSFGEYSLETISSVDTVFTEAKTAGPFIWSSKGGNDDAHVAIVSMEGGWTCDVSSVKVNYTGNEGRKDVDWFDKGNKSEPTAAMWQMLTTPTTWHSPGGHDGVIQLDILYNRFQQKNIEVSNKRPFLPLSWGQKVVLSLPRDAVWKLIFRKYNGNVIELASTNEKSSLIKLTNIKNRQLALQVAPFDNL